ncbi:MAG: hypothetical protein DCC51_15410 [Anaerolineae bacterium]|nr:MAG: hypothetical protein DCC51_15410 [Anaerolineae bacterium]
MQLLLIGQTDEREQMDNNKGYTPLADENARRAEIQAICQRQKITSLVHFTRLENLESILQRGLLSVAIQNKYSIKSIRNDPLRLDQQFGAISLSISFPNFQLFFKFRNEKPSDWVVIELDASILWELDCAFCRENAASNAVRQTLLSNRKKANALDELFDDYPEVSRADSRVPSFFPTHPQAEVLVFKPIPIKYFKTVFFPDENSLKRWNDGRDPSFDCKFEPGPNYFQLRVDYASWQSNSSRQEITHELDMAKRPIFVPNPKGTPYVEKVDIEFQWHPGFSLTQAQKSIASLHAAAKEKGYSRILEISTKSQVDPGISLSAFNLQLSVPGRPPISVECAFQGSKVFKNGGPYTDLYEAGSYAAKKDERLHTSGDLIGFNFMGMDYPIKPVTAFFNWLYLRALLQNKTLADQLKDYDAFSDIAFNPGKSFNCQARAAALYVALSSVTGIENIIEDAGEFWKLVENESDENGSRGGQQGFSF